MQVAILNAAPQGHGSLSATPPHSILTRGAPTLELSIRRISGTVGRLVLRVMTYTSRRGWRNRGLIEVTPSSANPFERKLTLSEEDLYACVVKVSDEGWDGTAEAYLNATYNRATDGGLEAVEEHEEEGDAHPIYLTKEEADALYAPIGVGGGGAGSVEDILLGGGEGVDDGGGVFRFELGLTPSSIAAVIYDGAPLYRNQTPGFSWSGGSSSLTIRPPYGNMPAAAKILVLKQ